MNSANKTDDVIAAKAEEAYGWIVRPLEKLGRMPIERMARSPAGFIARIKADMTGALDDHIAEVGQDRFVSSLLGDWIPPEDRGTEEPRRRREPDDEVVRLATDSAEHTGENAESSASCRQRLCKPRPRYVKPVADDDRRLDRFRRPSVRSGLPR